MNQTSKNKQASNATRLPNNMQQQSIKTLINIPKQNDRSDGASAKITKQTYLKKTGGSNLQTPQQQSSNQPIQIINAPTSLTNLAQFSGITILPIGNIGSDIIHGKQILPCHIPPNVSLHQLSPNNNQQYQNHTISTNDHPIDSQQTKSVIRFNSVGSSSQQSTYNSSASVQLLSQNSNESTPNQWRNTNMSSSKLKNNFQQKQSNISSSISRVNGKKDKTNSLANLYSYPNDLQVIPISDGLPLLAELSDMQPSRPSCNYDDLSAQPITGAIAGEQYSADAKEDVNNISLMKLIAILNNPALTVTAVSNRNSSTSSNQGSVPDIHQSSTTNIINSHLTGLSNEPLHDHVTGDYFSQAIGQTKQGMLDISISKKRIPQSAANIQVVHNESASSLSALKSRLPSTTSISRASDRNTKDFSTSPITSSTPKQPNLRIDWLPELTPASSGGSATLFRMDNPVPMNESHSYLHDKHTDPILLSTSVRNLMMQQLSSSTKPQAVSVQLLKHIANQTKDNDWISEQAQKSILEPECILSIPSRRQQLNQAPKRYESSHKVSSSDIREKISKKPIQSSKDRLYIPHPEGATSIANSSNFNLFPINIDTTGERMVYVNERHFMLESLMSDKSNNQQQNKSVMPEPDEIFINRSKRIMSKIDTMIERKKRRRFERISGRSAPKASSLEDQCAESEDEWSDDDNMEFEYTGLNKTQFPLEEIETEEKKNHLLSVGLVSRPERNKLLIEECQKKMLLFTPLAFEEPNGVSEDIQRFVHTILKTGGTDVQLRTESNIKRNDLPLIEGLNRNTSRMKMQYMNVLGLEKRSKRTTLYKVKQMDNLNNRIAKFIDLNKINSANLEKPKLDLKPDVSVNNVVDKPILINPILKPNLTITSCRDVAKPPNKGEYMKSLGLMAS